MKRRAQLNLSLYLITDPVIVGSRSLLDVVGESVSGGVRLVQVRDKDAEAKDLLEQTLALKTLLDPLGVPLVVNDRVDVAAAAGVGCHIGQTDLPPKAARNILGEQAIIGLSIDDPDQTKDADPAILDYVAHGPFASTDSKVDAGAPVGKDSIGRVRAKTPLPLVAIGGLSHANAADAIEAGADGVAVISAIVGAVDPKASAEKLKRVVDGALAMRRKAVA
jgi:thiamine-phosphate pyrophosphorylase